MKYEKKIKKMLESISRKRKLFRRKKYAACFLIGVLLISTLVNYEEVFSNHTPEPEQETATMLPEETKEPSKEEGVEGVTSEPEQETSTPLPEETKEPSKEEGVEGVTPEPEQETATILPEETKEPSKEEGVEGVTPEPGQETSTPLPEETKEPSKEEGVEGVTPEPEQETTLPIESQEPEDSDKKDNIEETIDPSASPQASETPEEKKKKEQKLEEEIIHITVPTDVSITIDPYNILGNGQIHSTEIPILNENEFDIEVKLGQAEYYLNTETEIETDIVKDCNLYIEREGTEFKHLLEIGLNENVDSIRLKSGEINNYRFTGDIVPGTEFLWRENDIRVILKFSFEKYQNDIQSLEEQ